VAGRVGGRWNKRRGETKNKTSHQQQNK